MKKFLKELKFKGYIGFTLAKYLAFVKKVFDGYYLSDEKYLAKRFIDAQGYNLDLKNPTSLNEKLQWLKLNDRNTLYTQLADKYAIREYIEENFGEKYLIPLCFVTDDYKEINNKNLPDYPFIVKANHDSANYRIIRDKNLVDWKRLQIDCKWWLTWNYYKVDREFQYSDIPRKIIVEKLLTDKKSKIPNDYKLNYINGKLEFIYVSVDRESGNFRNIYSKDWEPLDFNWANKKKLLKDLRGPEIPPPPSLQEMISIADKIAKLYAYVRVDFYDVDGKLYMGEITQCHGGGFDQFKPQSFDFLFGEKLNLKKNN